MKAWTLDRYGGPEALTLTELARPAPGPGEVLVRNGVAATAAGDWHLMRGDPYLVRLMFGLRRPRFGVLGSDVAGTVEEVGRGVDGLAPGDAVVGHLAAVGFGGFAEFVCAPAEAFVPKPAELSWEEAAALPGSALAALDGLRKGDVAEGMRVLVNGASGGVGSAAVQIAKALGTEVTGVCSGRNAEMVRALGADDVIDYAKEDFADRGARWDLVLDAAAFGPVRPRLRAVAKGGSYVLVGGDFSRTLEVMFLGALLTRLTGKKVTFFIARHTREKLAWLTELAGSGRLRPVVERRYAFAELPEALRHQESGRVRGKLVVTV